MVIQGKVSERLVVGHRKMMASNMSIRMSVADLVMPQESPQQRRGAGSSNSLDSSDSESDAFGSSRLVRCDWEMLDQNCVQLNLREIAPPPRNGIPEVKILENQIAQYEKMHPPFKIGHENLTADQVDEFTEFQVPSDEYKASRGLTRRREIP